MAEGGQPQAGANRQQQVQIAEQLQNQLGQLENQREQIQAYIDELEETQDAIRELAEQEPGEHVLLPIGSGAYVHAELKETDAVLAPLGSGLLAEEAPKKALDRIENRRDEARNATDEIGENIQQLRGKLEQLVQQIQGGGAQQPPADE